MTPGLGFLFNNYMNVFNPHPGPRRLRWPPGKRRAAEHGARRSSPDAGAAGRCVARGGSGGHADHDGGAACASLNVLDLRRRRRWRPSRRRRVDCQGQIVECGGTEFPGRLSSGWRRRGTRSAGGRQDSRPVLRPRADDRQGRGRLGGGFRPAPRRRSPDVPSHRGSALEMKLGLAIFPTAPVPSEHSRPRPPGSVPGGPGGL